MQIYKYNWNEKQLNLIKTEHVLMQRCACTDVGVCMYWWWAMHVLLQGCACECVCTNKNRALDKYFVAHVLNIPVLKPSISVL